MIRHLYTVFSLVVYSLHSFFKCLASLFFSLQCYGEKSVSLGNRQVEFFLLFQLTGPMTLQRTLYFMNLNSPFYSFQKLSLTIHPCLVGIIQSTRDTNTLSSSYTHRRQPTCREEGSEQPIWTMAPSIS